MKNNKFKVLATVLCTGIFLLGLASKANATLESRLGGLAYYDTDLNISWLADANAGAGSIFDDGFDNTDGKMTWGNANAWAESLNIGGVMGWRLPTLSPIDGNDFDYVFSNNAMTDDGYATSDSWRNDSGNSVSEMGHMYYVNLGNIGFCTPDNASPNGCNEQTGWGLSSTGPFSNLQSTFYWTDVEFELDPSGAWSFAFVGGSQSPGDKDGLLSLAWAVHSGDVGAVSMPEPGSIVLIGLAGGLLGLWRRRR